ncbi:MAG: gliding motility-associated C-terminal domain-containing protein [Saprospiraceae bacterium]
MTNLSTIRPGNWLSQYPRASTIALCFTLLFFNVFKLSAQPESCGCAEKEAITVCYFSVADLCYGNVFSCGYAFDGQFMENALLKKLLNPQNFGDGGKVGCRMEIKKINPIMDVQSIKDCGCDIIFTGHFPVNTENNTINFNYTSIPQPTLQAIKNWSSECDDHLVIVSQIEAATWGYTIENSNRNPNTPVSGIPLLSVFDGPFGRLNSFLQGGSYQGVITKMPETGGAILAQDANNKPTIVLDKATNDIILGDIGILCSNGAGSVSSGDMIRNNNDILACNLFALGCNIADGTKYSHSVQRVCSGASIVLPNGTRVQTPGIYVDTLLAANGCDSIIYTELISINIDTTYYRRTACIGDEFNITINGMLYNELHPRGQEILQNQYGCDSIVIIDLNYLPPVFDTIRQRACKESGFSITVNNVIYNESNPSGRELLQNQYGCDSTVIIDLTFLPISVDTIQKTICKGSDYNLILNNVVYNEKNPIGRQVFENQYGCDSVLLVNIATFPPPKVKIDTTINVKQHQPFIFNNHIPAEYDVIWQSPVQLSCNKCPNPEILQKSYVETLQLSIRDTNECITNYTIHVNYTCDPFIPNAFSPNNDGVNDVFQIFSTCPYNDYNMIIFDRWGSKIFQSTDSTAGWDGLVNGVAAQQGAYVYFISVQENGKEKTFSGTITLIR